METKIENGKIIITLPIEKKESKSGRTFLVASTGGFKDTSVQFEGKTVKINVTATIAKE